MSSGAIIALGVALIVSLVGGLIWQARAAGRGADAKEDLRATTRAVRAGEKARRKPWHRGRDLADWMRGGRR